MMTSVLIIVAGIALAIAIQAIVLHWHSMRLMKGMWRHIDEEIASMRSVTISLAEQFNQGDDFVADEPADISKGIEELTAKDTIPKVESQTRGEQFPTEIMLHNDMVLKQAHEIFSTRYRELCHGLDEHNMNERTPQLGQLLIEMGIWLKDFLPVSQGDFNATSDMRRNVDSVCLDEQERAEMLAAAKAPTENPYKTPIEVITLNRLMQQWGIKNLEVLFSGYRLNKGNDEQRQNTET